MSNRTKKARADALRKATGSSAFANTKTSQHITKISAKPANHSKEVEAEAVEQPVVTSVKAGTPAVAKADMPKPAKLSKAEKKALKAKKKATGENAEKPLRKVFILARPFVALGRYLRDSWREIRQVRWPSRKNTWKMTLAVLAYCAVFIVFIMLLDTFFTFLFKTFVK